MAHLTFREYLIELMVDVDPTDAAGTLSATKQALKNPERASKNAIKNNMDNQRSIQQNTDDPNSSEKLRISKMKQQLLRQEQRLKGKEESAAKRAGA